MARLAPPTPTPQLGNNKAPAHGNAGVVKKAKVHIPIKMAGNTRGTLQPDNVSCEVCFKIIKFRKNLPKHMSDAHGDEEKEKYSCCNISFTSKYNLARHTASKNCLLNLKHDCKKCKARFVSIEKLQIHIKKNCPKKYFCTICFQFFNKTANFESHKNNHDNEL